MVSRLCKLLLAEPFARAVGRLAGAGTTVYQGEWAEPTYSNTEHKERHTKESDTGKGWQWSNSVTRCWRCVSKVILGGQRCDETVSDGHESNFHEEQSARITETHPPLFWSLCILCRVCVCLIACHGCVESFFCVVGVDVNLSTSVKCKVSAVGVPRWRPSDANDATQRKRRGSRRQANQYNTFGRQRESIILDPRTPPPLSSSAPYCLVRSFTCRLELSAVFFRRVASAELHEDTHPT